MGAPRYLYDLAQMVLWGMAPCLGIAVLWAAGRRLWELVRRRSHETAVLAAWVLPCVLITGVFEVKFIRYLLPVYPVLILWAAAWLWKTGVSHGAAGGWAWSAAAIAREVLAAGAARP